MCFAVLFLLTFVILCQKRTLFLAEGSFCVIQALRNDSESLSQILLLFLELSDLQPDKVILVKITEILKKVGQIKLNSRYKTFL